MQFSSKALACLRKTIRSTNGPAKKRYSFNASSSGCPAQHRKPSADAIERGELEKLSQVFGKSPEELLVEHEQSVAQAGLSYIVKGLKGASSAFDEKMSVYNKQLLDRPVCIPDGYLTHSWYSIFGK